MWLCIIPGVLLKFHGVALCCSRFLSAAHWVGSVSFDLSNCCPLGWLHVDSIVPLLLTGVALSHLKCTNAVSPGCSASFEVSLTFTKVATHFRCPTIIYWCGFVLFHESICRLLGWLCIVPGSSLLFTGMDWFCFSCPIATLLGGSSLSQASY